jgi:hypothetical protein
MSTVFFITDGSGVGGDNAELARSFKWVVTGPRSQPAARWARTSGEARLEREEKQRVSRRGRGIRQFGHPRNEEKCYFRSTISIQFGCVPIG